MNNNNNNQNNNNTPSSPRKVGLRTSQQIKTRFVNQLAAPNLPARLKSQRSPSVPSIDFQFEYSSQHEQVRDLAALDQVIDDIGELNRVESDDFSTMTSGNSSDLSNSKLLSRDDRQLRRSDTLTTLSSETPRTLQLSQDGRIQSSMRRLTSLRQSLVIDQQSSERSSHTLTSHSSNTTISTPAALASISNTRAADALYSHLPPLTLRSAMSRNQLALEKAKSQPAHTGTRSESDSISNSGKSPTPLRNKRRVSPDTTRRVFLLSNSDERT
eukprot:CAMPEP_0168605586 /NCGR_PEP_ID=MMETSP0420-20121227/16067_1 /TAXON_ID=498008 /ORGANISM="Pessonella sp." /LENGTH=270 /DNA_ID=CAMNT_0008645095 /DNA_START=160 /DNA_END=968 /DNA_ORIENTATION=+